MVPCLGDDWVKTAQNNTSKPEEMINRKKRKMVDRTRVEIE